MDGSHYSEDVYIDVLNSMRILNPGGIVLMHDCNPQTKSQQIIPPNISGPLMWTGDVWRVAVFLRTMSEIEIVIADFDYGVGVIQTRPNENRLSLDFETRVLQNNLNAFNYEEFDENREILLRFKTFDEIKKWLL